MFVGGFVAHNACISCDDSFATTVLFLKVLMSQQGFDKPFTGGLGSYKLYVLVAFHVSATIILRLLRVLSSIKASSLCRGTIYQLERHLANGGTDRPAEVLIR